MVSLKLSSLFTKVKKYHTRNTTNNRYGRLSKPGLDKEKPCEKSELLKADGVQRNMSNFIRRGTQSVMFNIYSHKDVLYANIENENGCTELVKFADLKTVVGLKITGVTWVEIVKSYASCNLDDEVKMALEIWFRSGGEKKHVPLLQPTDIDLCKLVHATAIKLKEPLRNQIKCHLVSAYSKTQSLITAVQLFKELEKPNVQAYNNLLYALGEHGKGLKALDTMETMQKKKLKVDETTMKSILFACSHSGLSILASKKYASMVEKYQIQPTLKHASTLVDALGRIGHFEMALQFIENAEISKKERNKDELLKILVGTAQYCNPILVLRCLKMLSKHDPHYEKMRAHCHFLLGNYDQSAEIWDKIEKTGGKNVGKRWRVSC